MASLSSPPCSLSEFENPPFIGAVEAGGTKIIVAAGTGPDDLTEPARIPTTTPEETLARVVAALRECEERAGRRLEAIGVGTFGPAGVNPAAADFGFITTTPKPGWAHTDVLGALRRAFDVPMAFDTDVNAAVCAEAKWGAGRGRGTALYLTVGTGIGGGLLVNGEPLHGLLHPEMGHMRLPRAPGDEAFPGACPWHGDCLEGLASGPAIEKRWNAKGDTLPPDHPAWETEAHYLATACANFLTILSPERVILGGGVMDQPRLLPLVREKTARLLNGYLNHPDIVERGLETVIVAPELGSRAGVLGALALALRMF